MNSTVWIVRTGEHGRYADAFERHSVVGCDVPYPRSALDRTAEEIVEELISAHQIPLQRARYQATVLTLLANGPMRGDVVAAPDPGRRLVLFARDRGRYKYLGEPLDGALQHLREVEFAGKIPWAELDVGLRRALGSPMGVYRPGQQEGLIAAARMATIGS